MKTPNYNRYKKVYTLKGTRREHTVLAEKALGKPLPIDAEVHHGNEKHDNTCLVICQDRAYHMLLHRRTKALQECGHANWLKCQFCKTYDDPKNLKITPRKDGRKGFYVYHQPNTKCIK